MSSAADERRAKRDAAYEAWKARVNEVLMLHIGLIDEELCEQTARLLTREAWLIDGKPELENRHVLLIAKAVGHENRRDGLDDWEKAGRDRDGNLTLRYKPSGGLYRLIPEEEFASSLGAIFPESAFEFDGDDGEPLEVKYAPGRRVRYVHPDYGYPGEQEAAAELLVLGAAYTIARHSIGQSRTDLILEGIPGEWFNSVLFGPADDEAAAAAREEE